MRVLTIIGFFFVATNGIAQELLTEEQAVAYALKNSAVIRSAEYEVEAARQLRKTSFDLPKTDVSVMFGQYNSYSRDDNNITISQTIPFTAFGSQGALNRSQITSSTLKKSVEENTLIYEVRRTYNQLSYAYSRRALLLQEDSIFEGFYKAASLRFKTGESTLLEQATADAQRNEARNRIRLNDADIVGLRSRLRALLSSDFIPDIAGKGLIELNPTVPLDTSVLQNNPSLAYTRQQIDVSGHAQKLERARFAPDFRIGYFNQTLIGAMNPANGELATSSERFSGFQVGISLPLWFGPHHGRVKSAAYRQKEAESNYTAEQLNMQAEVQRALEQFQASRNSLTYYHSSALPNADLILRHAQTGFREGDIDYAAYLLSLRSAMQIRENYLQSLRDYNQNVIYIEFLSGYKSMK
jgi:cobalt-zinc-cadmium resistance protein CzcA